MIWILQPCYKILEIVLNFTGKVIRLTVRNGCDPVFESIGAMYSQIQIRHNKKVDSITKPSPTETV